MEKPFLTIEQQVELLRKRGMRVDGGTAPILMREGYYSVVNGYKEPFIDARATREARDDRYKEGSSFDSMYGLFAFDRDLRELTFHYLIRAEATVRTAVAYCFSDAHRDPEAYLLQANYCSRDEYASYGMDPDDYADEVSGLTWILGKRAKTSRTEFVEHYRNAYGGVPLWVLCNDLTFGNVEHFFHLMKPAEKAAVCKTISESTGRRGDRRLGFFNVSEAQVSLEALVKFRNICAHDERIYCAKVGGRKNINYERMVWYLERYLTREEFHEFILALIDLINRSLAKNGTVAQLVGPLGFFELAKKIKGRANTPA